MRGNDQFPFFKIQNFRKGAPHSLVGGHPPLEGNGREDDLAFGDITFKVPGYGKT